MTETTATPSHVQGCTLLGEFLSLMGELARSFPQKRTWLRAKRLMLSGLLTIGRHWISRMISTSGRDQMDWSADYRLFSRSPWHAHELFAPAVRQAIAMANDGYVAVALDETKLARPGRMVKASTWFRDPLSPPFHVNLVRGIRFLHFVVLLPLHRFESASCRGIPIRLEMVEVVKKPGKRATDQDWETYRSESKRKNLSVSAVAHIKAVRETFDGAGGGDKFVIVVGDGSFCNRTVLRASYERTIVVARARKDARLCRPAASPSRKYYDPKTFTPEDVRHDEQVPWQQASIHHGGEFREVRYKELKPILWQGGTGRELVRLIVLAPTPYRVSKNSRTDYREAGYLLTRDVTAPATTLIQAYFDRWQIEVNHRDIKDTLGLGDAQVWADKSVPRQPSFVAASYSLLLLAGLKAYGPNRTDSYEPLPKWRRHASRPSCLDLVTQLRKEAINHPEALSDLGLCLADHSMVRKAAG